MMRLVDVLYVHSVAVMIR